MALSIYSINLCKCLAFKRFKPYITAIIFFRKFMVRRTLRGRRKLDMALKQTIKWVNKSKVYNDKMSFDEMLVL